MKNLKFLNWLVLMTLLFVTTLSITAQNEIFRIQKNFSSVSKIDVQGGALNVSVYGSDRSDVMVSAFIKGMDSQKDLLKVETKLNGDVLTVSYVGGDSFNGVTGEIRIMVPQTKTALNARTTSGKIDVMSLSGSIIDISSASGNLMMMDLNGQCAARTTSGKVSISKIVGDVRAESLSSAVSVANVIGNAKFLAGSGAVTGANINGKIVAKTGSASIKLVAIKGNIEIRTASGFSEIDDVDGKIDVTTASGSVVVEKIKGYFDCETASGDIKGVDVTLVEGADLSTISGSISVQLNNQVNELTYDLSSASGKISAKGVVGERSITSGSGSILVKGSTVSGDLIIE